MKKNIQSRTIESMVKPVFSHVKWRNYCSDWKKTI